jgi:hypothetical protein
VPELLAGTGVEGVDVVERCRDIHDAVHDNRRCFHRLLDFGLEQPGRTELHHITGVDLPVRVIAGLLVVAIGVQEIVTVAGGAVQQILCYRLHIAVFDSRFDLLGTGRCTVEGKHGQPCDTHRKGLPRFAQHFLNSSHVPHD